MGKAAKRQKDNKDPKLAKFKEQNEALDYLFKKMGIVELMDRLPPNEDWTFADISQNRLDRLIPTGSKQDLLDVALFCGECPTFQTWAVVKYLDKRTGIVFVNVDNAGNKVIVHDTHRGVWMYPLRLFAHYDGAYGYGHNLLVTFITYIFSITGNGENLFSVDLNRVAVILQAVINRIVKVYEQIGGFAQVLDLHRPSEDLAHLEFDDREKKAADEADEDEETGSNHDTDTATNGNDEDQEMADDEVVDEPESMVIEDEVADEPELMDVEQHPKANKRKPKAAKTKATKTKATKTKATKAKVAKAKATEAKATKSNATNIDKGKKKAFAAENSPIITADEAEAEVEYADILKAVGDSTWQADDLPQFNPKSAGHQSTEDDETIDEVESIDVDTETTDDDQVVLNDEDVDAAQILLDFRSDSRPYEGPGDISAMRSTLRPQDMANWHDDTPAKEMKHRTPTKDTKRRPPPVIESDTEESEAEIDVDLEDGAYQKAVFRSVFKNYRDEME